MTKDNEIMQAAKQICEEKNISFESVIQTIEAALAVAYRKDFGEKNQNIKVEFDINKAKARVFDVKTVVTDEKAELTEKLKEEKKAQEEAEEEDKSGEAGPGSAGEKEKKVEKSKPDTKKLKEKEEGKPEDEEEEKIERFNPKTEITLSEAKKIRKDAKLEEVIKTELLPPAAYGRMATQTAKQVIVQRLREAERETVYKEFKEKEGDVINGTIQRVEGKMVLVDLGPATALLPPPEQTPRERYASGQRFKFFVVAVNTTPKGPEIILSRSHAEMVKKLFYLEVPEVGNDSVEIKSIAREAGSRTKIAVTTNQKNIDPVGSCVGQRGSRVQTIISEIGGEKIDIIEWDEDPIKYITNALSPAKVLSVQINDEEKTALAEVKEDQLSLAIGKAGQNVRLSAKLTGWKIDIVSDRGEKVVPEAKGKDDQKPVADDGEHKDKEKSDQDEPISGGKEEVKEEAETKPDKKKKESAKKEKKSGKAGFPPKANAPLEHGSAGEKKVDKEETDKDDQPAKKKETKDSDQEAEEKEENK